MQTMIIGLLGAAVVVSLLGLIDALTKLAG
jgi:hypothetical protein